MKAVCRTIRVGNRTRKDENWPLKSRANLTITHHLLDVETISCKPNRVKVSSCSSEAIKTALVRVDFSLIDY